MSPRTDAEDRPSIRTLITLTVVYVAAAGFHGVLAVLYRVWWHGVVAIALTVAAAALLAHTVRTTRRRRTAGGSPVVPLRRHTASAFGWYTASEHGPRPHAARESDGSTPGPGDTRSVGAHDETLL